MVRKSKVVEPQGKTERRLLVLSVIVLAVGKDLPDLVAMSFLSLTAVSLYSFLFCNFYVTSLPPTMRNVSVCGAKAAGRLRGAVRTTTYTEANAAPAGT